MKRFILAVVLTACSTLANAATLQLTLVSTISDSPNGAFEAILSDSTATWTYDTDTTLVTGTGLYVEQSQINPNIPGALYTRNISDLVAGGNATASAASFSCFDGSLTGVFGASFCGNYGFGPNFANDSSVTYGPGTNASRDIQPDDSPVGPMQTIADYDGMVTTWDGMTTAGTTVSISNAVAGVSGQTMNFVVGATIVPIPAAAWLFGTALGFLTWTRARRITA